MELTARQQAAIDAANKAMRRVLAEAYPAPADHGLLFVSAVVGSFAALARGELGRELVNLINAELKPANLVLSRRTGVGAVNHPLTKKRA
jgi:hypothetical protein